MTTWDVLRPKLGPNPQQHKALPILFASVVATAAGGALMVSSLVILLGIHAYPASLADLRKESTWTLLLGVACLYMLCRVIGNGNHAFGVHRPLGYSWVLSSTASFVAVVYVLADTAMRFTTTALVLQDPLMMPTILCTFLVGALLLRAGNIRRAHARLYLAKVVRSPTDLRGINYCLYLRTFAQDRDLSGAQSHNPVKRALRGLFVAELPEEALLADALSGDDIPMIGVGRPGEAAPPMGALRVYLPREGWKPQVHDFIKEARHVVLALGWGEGTVWELGEAMRILTPEQLILVVPMEHSEYERFRRETAKSLPVGLPAYAGRGEIRSAVRGLITFSEDWESTFVPIRAYSPFHNSLRYALIFAAWPSLRRLGYQPRGLIRLAPNTVADRLTTTSSVRPRQEVRRPED